MPMPKKPRPPCKSCGKPVKRPTSTYCDNQCQKDFEYREFIRRWKAGEVSGNIRVGSDSVSRHVRRYLMEKHGEKCEKCGWSERHPTTGLVPLTVDHKDGDGTNTAEENLRLLCPNCHSLTPTYGNLNKGNGRKTRRKTRNPDHSRM